MSEMRGRYALVTGASSGLGADFARQLAAQGVHLGIVARRVDRLEGLAEELRKAHGVEVDVLASDLSQGASVDALLNTLSERGRHVDILINNAGLAVFGTFAEVPWDRTEQMLQVDMVTLTQLTRKVLPGMIARRYGRVLNVASIAGFQSSPGYACYSACKSYVIRFTDAIAFELRGTNVTATSLCPGVTQTEFLDVAGQPMTFYYRLLMMQSADVVRIGLRAMQKGKVRVITGLLNTLSVVLVNLLPRGLARHVVNRLMHF